MLSAVDCRTDPPLAANDIGPRRLLVDTGQHIEFVDLDDIRHVEADGNYVVLQTHERRYVIRMALHSIEAHLWLPQFMRISRSVIVNTHWVRSMERWAHGEFRVEMTDGRRFTSGRRYRQRLRDLVVRAVHTESASAAVSAWPPTRARSVG